MKKKINKSKVLFVLLVFIGIGYGISTLFSEKKEPPFAFEANLIEVDTNTISRIDLFLKSEDYEKITIQKEQSDWLITKKNFTTKADRDSISQLLKTIHTIRTDRIVANQANKWKQFAVQNQQSNQVQVYTNGVLQEDFYITTAHFTQTNVDTSFIRLAHENEIYAAAASVSTNVDRGFNAYRKTHILKVDSKQLSRLEIMNGISMDTIILKDKTWTWNTMPLDSLEITNYLDGLKSVSGTSFVDDFDELDNEKLLSHQVKLTVSDQLEPILIRCYTDTLRAKPFIIHSNMNKDAYFASDSTGIYQRLFKNVSDFVK